MRLGYEGPLRTDRQGRVIVLTKAAACRGRATEALTATPRERALSAHPPAIRWFRRRKRCTTRLHGGHEKTIWSSFDRLQLQHRSVGADNRLSSFLSPCSISGPRALR